MTAGGVSAALRVREFRYLWFADLASTAGDQLARVALAVLVYGRTGSAVWAAVTYALTFLPALLGGVLLSWLADRFRRREVMVVADLLRAVLVAVMAVPDLPLWAVGGLLVVVVLLGSPFTAAHSALLPDILPGDLYERGLAVRQITSQSAQLAGFAGGGVLVAVLSPPVALLADALTFVLSALLIRFGVANRPPAGAAHTDKGSGTAAAIASIVTDPGRRALVLLAWLVGWYVVPEGLAAPYADQLGSVLGAWLFTRFVPSETRSRLTGVLAVAAGIPLMLSLLRPGLPVTVVLWGLSGAFSTAYLLQTHADFVRATPDPERGRAIGVAAHRGGRRGPAPGVDVRYQFLFRMSALLPLPVHTASKPRYNPRSPGPVPSPSQVGAPASVRRDVLGVVQCVPFAGEAWYPGAVRQLYFADGHWARQVCHEVAECGQG